jgi:hypothetical protein
MAVSYVPPPAGASACVLAARQYVAAATATVVISGISAAYRQLKVQWMARHDMPATALAMYMRVNGDATASYHGSITTQAAAVQTPLVLGGQAGGRVGVIGGVASAGATGGTSGGTIDINSWNTGAGSLGRCHFTFQSQFYENSSMCYYEHGGSFYNVAPPYTQLSFYVGSGANIQAGSEFTVYGFA